MPDKPADAFPSNPWPLLLALVVLLAGVVLVLMGHWRRGAVVIAGALGLAAVLRMVLPRRMAGLLVVRRWWVDVIVMLACAVAVAGLAMVVPGR